MPVLRPLPSHAPCCFWPLEMHPDCRARDPPSPRPQLAASTPAGAGCFATRRRSGRGLVCACGGSRPPAAAATGLVLATHLLPALARFCSHRSPSTGRGLWPGRRAPSTSSLRTWPPPRSGARRRSGRLSATRSCTSGERCGSARRTRAGEMSRDAAETQPRRSRDAAEMQPRYNRDTTELSPPSRCEQE